MQMWYFSVASQGSIIPMLSFQCLFIPICAAVIPHRVCIVGEDSKSSTYPVNMYDITNNLSLAHPSTFEHTSLVVAISSSVKFRIFATASSDGILKIWDDQNILVLFWFSICCAYFSQLRTMDLHAELTSCMFLNDHAHLLVAVQVWSVS